MLPALAKFYQVFRWPISRSSIFQCEVFFRKCYWLIKWCMFSCYFIWRLQLFELQYPHLKKSETRSRTPSCGYIVEKNEKLCQDHLNGRVLELFVKVLFNLRTQNHFKHKNVFLIRLQDEIYNKTISTTKLTKERPFVAVKRAHEEAKQKAVLVSFSLFKIKHVFFFC